VRQSGWLLRITVAVVCGLAAAAGVVAATSRSDLADAKARVDAAWAGVRPGLDQRYAALGRAGDAVRSRLGDDRPLLGDVLGAVKAWPGTATASAETQVKAASRLEGLGARLASLVAATPRLRSSGDVTGALDAVARRVPTGGGQAYNDAVAGYERVRGGFPRRLVAGVLGFGTSRTLELPG
jgi:hypothetical protein